MMTTELEALRGTALPGPPVEFLAAVEARVTPILFRRRVVRRGRQVAAAALALVGISFLWPWTNLHELSSAELLEKREKLKQQQPQVSGSLMFIPIETIVESTDVVVQVVVEEVTVNKERLVADIKAKRVRPLYLKVEFRLVESYPPLPGESLVVSSTGELEHMAAGKAFLMALKKENGVLRPLYSFRAQGIYPIRGEGPEATVSGLVRSSMTLDAAWSLIRTIHDHTHGNKQLPPEVIEEHVRALKSGSLAEAELALELLSLGAKDAMTTEVLVEALEGHYARLMAKVEIVENQYYRTHNPTYAALARKMLALLYAQADRHAAERLLTLYVKDLSNIRARVFDDSELRQAMFRLALKHPGPDRHERVLGLLGKKVTWRNEKTGGRLGGTEVVKPNYRNLKALSETPGADIDQLLREIFARPTDFGLRGELALAALWQGMAQRGMEEIRPYLETIVADPLKADYRGISIRSHRSVAAYARDHLKLLDGAKAEADPNSRQQAWSLSQDELARQSPSLIADVLWLDVPAPALGFGIRKVLGHEDLRQAAGQEQWPWPQDLPDCPPILRSLLTAGHQPDAADVAGQLLSVPIHDFDLDHFGADLAGRCGALRYLGKTGDVSLAPAIEALLDPKVLAKYTKAHERAYQVTVSKTGPERRNSLVRKSPARRPAAEELRTAALLALTRLGQRQVLAEWRSRYREGSAGQRMTAAIALFYLGDDASKEMIEAFATRTERSIDLLDRHLSAWGATGEFQKTIRYLRSPQTDALFLRRIQLGVGNGDTDLVRARDFLRDHVEEILPLLVKHLDSRDMITRGRANSCLGRILGPKPGWQQYALAGTQPELVEKCRAEVQAYLELWRSRPAAAE
ncbi:hypothetical protein ACFL34_02425 [Candidatus Sumerlaeota bacterium]